MRSMHIGVRHTCGLHMTGQYRPGSGVHLQHQCVKRGELRHNVQVHDVAAQGKLQRLQRKPAPRVPTMLSALPNQMVLNSPPARGARPGSLLTVSNAAYALHHTQPHGRSMRSSSRAEERQARRHQL